MSYWKWLVSLPVRFFQSRLTYWTIGSICMWLGSIMTIHYVTNKVYEASVMTAALFATGFFIASYAWYREFEVDRR